MTVSLKSHNTLGLAHQCQDLIVIKDMANLIKACQSLAQTGTPMLVLSGGSNIVLTDDFQGTVIKVETKGIDVTQTQNTVSLTVQAGENWHELVCYCLENDYHGLENLALIPGCVGAAPIQNIGAYGVEISQFCTRVDYLCLETYQQVSLTKAQCQFGYRDSVFKHALKGKAIITAVTFNLPKQWQPNLSYGPLTHLDINTVTARQIFDAVCHTRQQKLPNPDEIGNVGSFFKNPIIAKQQFHKLKQQYQDVVGYPQSNGLVKVAAGWLIDQAGLKGMTINNVGVHSKQALVLVNHGEAKGEEICQLARHVIAVVEQKFSITLEAEPRLIGATGEITL
ncbi:UDP-N-acetylmuramate dehydrogenase [Shewanella maritima]|uniref:UDP-N-acetylmuramate dehydrogenase n=1 Tax=Shewanella maritima TaxID=2520507 RepID=UPI003734D242